jgi:segregation and condensation protein A
MSVDYRVRLDSFEGPLDLLLFLIRRAEVEITDIPVGTIADQYVEFLAKSGVEHIDIDTAGEFLLMAATLMELKSRSLTPQSACDETGVAITDGARGEEGDPRAELVRQLLAYKRFRDAASTLESRRSEWERRFPSGKAGTDNAALRDAMMAQAGEVDVDDLSLIDLAGAFAKIAASVNFERLGEHEVTYDDTPIELHAEDILDRLRRALESGETVDVPDVARVASEAAADHAPAGATTSLPGWRAIPLQGLFSGRKRGEMIGLFLATLELVRRRAIRLQQASPGAEILIGLRASESASADSHVASESAG